MIYRASLAAFLILAAAPAFADGTVDAAIGGALGGAAGAAIGHEVGGRDGAIIGGAIGGAAGAAVTTSDEPRKTVVIHEHRRVPPGHAKHKHKHGYR